MRKAGQFSECVFVFQFVVVAYTLKSWYNEDDCYTVLDFYAIWMRLHVFSKQECTKTYL